MRYQLTKSVPSPKDGVVRYIFFSSLCEPSLSPLNRIKSYLPRGGVHYWGETTHGEEVPRYWNLIEKKNLQDFKIITHSSEKKTRPGLKNLSRIGPMSSSDSRDWYQGINLDFWNSNFSLIWFCKLWKGGKGDYDRPFNITITIFLKMNTSSELHARRWPEKADWWKTNVGVGRFAARTTRHYRWTGQGLSLPCPWEAGPFLTWMLNLNV